MSNRIKDILEYKPKVVERSVQSEVYTDGSSVYASDVYEENKCLDDLKLNAPSICLKKAEQAIEQCVKMIKEVVDSYLPTPAEHKEVLKYMSALSDGDYCVIDTFENKVINSKAGDTRLELLAPLHFMNKKMNLMKDHLITNAYGTQVNSDTAAKLDKEVMDIIEQTEMNGNPVANYGAIYLDSMIGNGMKEHFTDCIDFMTSVSDILEPTNPWGDIQLDEELTNTLDAGFGKNVETNLVDRRKLMQIEDSAFKDALAINMYKARQTLINNDRITGKTASLSDPELVTMFFEQIEESTAESLTLIFDFHKSNRMESMYREDFAITLRRKHGVRKLLG